MATQLVHDHEAPPPPHIVQIPMNTTASNSKKGSSSSSSSQEADVEAETIDYSQRAQWVRAAVLGANDGLVSVASLMMGVGGVKDDIKAMLLAGFAGLIAGACSMAIGEFVSVYTQRDIEVAQKKRDEIRRRNGGGVEASAGDDDQVEERLPNPLQAAIASALAFSLGAVMPLLAAAFVRKSGDHVLRLGVIGAVASLALVVFGGGGALLGRTPVMKSVIRVLVGGWLAMSVTYGMTRLIAAGGLEM